MQLKQDIKQHIIENFYYGQDDADLTDDISFLENGIIDSTGVLELVSFVQEKYDITVHDEDILPDNFDSISKLAAFVETKRMAASEQSADAEDGKHASVSVS